MTPHGKAHNRTHTQKPPVNSLAQKPGHRTTVHGKPEVESSPRAQFHLSRVSASQGLLLVVPYFHGGASWEANQARGGGCRRERTSEQLFILAEKIFRGSVSLCGRSGLTTLSAVSRSARNARNGMRASSLTASASRTPARCTRSTARSWMIETPERKITASPRRSIVGVGTDGAASASASQLSYLLAQVDPAAFKGASGDDRSHAPPATNTCSGPLAVSSATKQSPTRLSDYRGDQNSPGYAAVNADQLGCEGNRLSRRPDRNEGPWTAVGVTGGESAATNFQSALEPARVADTAAAPGLTDPPVAAAGSFEGRAA